FCCFFFFCPTNTEFSDKQGIAKEEKNEKKRKKKAKMTGHWFHGDGPTERWASWRENTHKQFHFNRRNALPLIFTTIVVPYAIYYFGREDLIRNDLTKLGDKADYL
ncbi:MAG: hypothetical protein K2Q09_04575, partial [Phycisphaerales bacterium]|nr:hypothetical protein [Phycisphaerales bacterium]